MPTSPPVEFGVAGSVAGGVDGGAGEGAVGKGCGQGVLTLTCTTERGEETQKVAVKSIRNASR
jgi:hypothetical protein